MTKWYCDVCGKEINTSDVKMETFIVRKTFCVECYNKFTYAVNEVFIKMQQDLRYLLKCSRTYCEKFTRNLMR